MIFFAFKPTLSPIGFYNDLDTGDTVRLFTLKVENVCAEEIRLFDYNTDPVPIVPQGANIGCGFTLGSINSLYLYNAPSENIIIPLSGSDVICIGFSTSILPNDFGTWTSSDNSVATITNAGIITGIAEGQSSFTFTNALTGCSSVPSEYVTVISSDPDEQNFYTCEHDSIQLTLDEIPESETYSWSPTTNLSDPTIKNPWCYATMDTPYQLTIEGENCSMLIDVNVVISTTPPSFITGDDHICIGQFSSASPTTGGTWTSSDEAVASIDNNGLITGISEGQANFIFMDSQNGCISDATIELTVVGPSVISLHGSDVIAIGETTLVSASAGATGVWTSDNPSIATINANTGTITGISQGM